MIPQRVVFKGVRDGIQIIIDADLELDELIECLEERSRLGRDFFTGATALIDVRSGSLPDSSLQSISNYLINEMGFGDVRIAPVPYPQLVQNEGQAMGQTESTSDIKSDDPIAYLPGASPDATLMVKRTLRSGQKVNYQGNVVIMGDVNPGAEVIAGGDIIVLGSLRGVAHAGATGNDQSSVFALKLQPTQLRISSFIARPPDGDNRVPSAPEVASIKDNGLVIETYSYR